MTGSKQSQVIKFFGGNPMNFGTPVVFLLALLTAQVGRANTITVTSTADSGAGTLRAALASATNGDTINFSLTTPARITLTTGELVVSNSISIIGPGPSNLRVDGNGISRVLHIRPSNTVTLASLTITNGAGGAGFGGGILNNHSTLAVSNCTLSGNSSAHGGGICNDGRNSGSAALTMVNSTIYSNTAAGYGGGILNVGDSGGDATLTVSNCSLIGNSAGNSGGGIDNKDWTAGLATLTVLASIVSSNSAGQFGGGIHNNGESAGRVTMTVIGSTFNGNSANAGGGINNDSRESGNAIGMVAGCTLSSNASHGSFASGGGIYNNAEFSGSAMLTVNNCILNGNWADYSTGGIYNDGYGGGSTAILNMASCTLTGNSSPVTGAIYNDGGNNGHATMTLNSSTISGNSSSNVFSAGAIFNNANLSVTNCTISGNSASGMFSAGGILNNGAPGATILTMIASTMSGNSATSSFSAGGIFNYIGAAQIGGTILNASGAGSNIVHSSGSIISLGYNLSSDRGGGHLTNTTDQINVNPMLGPLQNNGGLTPTHELLANSPAIDKGKSFSLTTDQRGRPRPYDASGITNASGGDGSDVGAFEVQAPAASGPILLTSSKTLDSGAFQFSFTNTPGASFTVVTSSNVALPLSNWTVLGSPSENTPGHFQFNDSQTTNRSQGFYGVRSP